VVAEVNIEDAGEDRIMKTEVGRTRTNESENGALLQRKTTGIPIIEVNIRLRNIVAVTEVCIICLGRSLF
jgi:hypothetical protein